MPAPMPAPGLADSFSGSSTIRAPMVIAVAAMLTAFCTASRVTRAGSTIPAFLRSIIPCPGFITLTPKPGLESSTLSSKAWLLSPAFSIIWTNGALRAFLTIVLPALSSLSSLARFTRVTPPPGTIPSSRAALVAATASSTRYFFSSISVSVAPPTLMTATRPSSAAARFSNCSVS